MTAFSPLLVAASLMTLSATTIAVGNTLIRSLGDIGIHPFEIAFFRCAFGFATAAPIVLWQTGGWPRTTAVRPLIASGLCHYASMLCFFTGVTLMPPRPSGRCTATAKWPAEQIHIEYFKAREHLRFGIEVEGRVLAILRLAFAAFHRLAVEVLVLRDFSSRSGLGGG